MANSPIQIVLNADDFRGVRPTGRGGRHTDFFAGHDDQFRTHKIRVLNEISAIAESIEKQPQGKVGFAKVRLRRAALAKSHRPTTALFHAERTALVGGLNLGEMIFEVTPQSLHQIVVDIQEAENETRMQPDSKGERITPNPSRRRSEVGAIEKIELYGPTDKRRFSVEQALSWLSDARTGQSYEVELFEYPPPRPQWDTLNQSRVILFESLLEGLQQFGPGIVAQPASSSPIAIPLLSIRLEHPRYPALVSFVAAPRASRSEQTRNLIDLNERRHAALLGFLENHPLVKYVRLPQVLVKSQSDIRSWPTNVKLPLKVEGQTYPKVGIIDGGLGLALSPWIIGKWDLLAPDHADPEHGTFIGGLLIGGQALNGIETCAEEDGTELYDLAILPKIATDIFESYYPNGVPGFLQELESAVESAKAQWGVRIFNLSINVEAEVKSDEYSYFAETLDRIAETHDVIFVISAGNLDGPEIRAEWPTDDASALGVLANSRNDGLLVPAESLRNISVSALNPPGLTPAIASALAAYSRRGPGLKTVVKPDFSHFGGAHTADAALGTGLFSIDVNGLSADGCGTSYAAPLVAKTLARLDSLIEGNTSRETLIALNAHHAEIPENLKQQIYEPVARHLVGFGKPRAVEQILEGEDHEITFVFASRLNANQQLSFVFQWPPSLVSPPGKCRGYARLTLASSPPINPKFGAECVRVNLEASLQQEIGARRWQGRLKSIFNQAIAEGHPYEVDLIEQDLKWNPTKAYVGIMPQGVGKSSTWRLVVRYLTRTGGQDLPTDGIPFTAVLTIGDIDASYPIFNEMRQTLIVRGARISDIRTAARITTRV